MLKRLKKISIIKVAILFSLALIIALALYWYLKPKPTLIDLQKEILTAQSREDTLSVLKKLDEYYLTMPIPESIRLEVEEAVDGLIREFDATKYTSEKLRSALDSLDEDIYLVEFNIRGVVRNAMVARSLDDHSTSRAIFSYAKSLADTVKTKICDQYWIWWLNEAEKYTNVEARNWLLADQASQLCFKHYTSDFEKGEKFAAFGLQRLKRTQDERIQLDLTQGFFVILSRSLSLHDLSFIQVERGIKKADEMRYRKRAIGLTFNYAEALARSGYNFQALNRYLETIKRANIVLHLPGINWYLMNARLASANAYRFLGNSDKAFSICEEIEKMPLNNYYMHVLHNTKAITFVFLGKYDLADAEYNKALIYAAADKDTLNQYIILSNIGRFYFRLSDYNKAIMFYQKALSLILESDPQNFEKQIRILTSIAEVEASRNNEEKFDSLIRKTEKLIKLINTPAIKGEHLVSLGQLNMKRQNYQQAYHYFFQADSIYEVTGMIRDGLETKINLVRCLIGFSDYLSAREQLDDLYETAIKIHDVPTQINAVGLSSFISYKEGDIKDAIKKSNIIINKIEKLSSQFTNLDNLTTFRQKIHPYLKNAVFYDLILGRVDSAFIKLDYLKARESKHKNFHNGLESNFNQLFVDIPSLMEQLTKTEMLINYFVTEDTLYAFVLNQTGIIPFRQSINVSKLRSIGNAYLQAIKNSRNLLDPYQPMAFNVNSDSVKLLSQKLYEILLGWKELESRLDNTKTIYIVPDDILYGIPFSCLMNLDKNNPKFLIHQAAVVNLPSAVFLQSFRSKSVTQNLRYKKVLICADRQEFPNVNKLVEFIKNKFPLAEELIVDKFSIENEDVISKLNEDFDIYFLIGHSIPNLEFPDLSYFQLTPLRKSDKMPFRLDISLNDLKRVDWSNAEMVFLIGCETAIGKLYEGSGFAGFQQTILTRGAKGVMASSWKIDNSIAFQQVKDFLNFWEQINDPALALQNVELEWIKHLQNDVFYKTAHPYLWKTLTISQTTKY